MTSTARLIDEALDLPVEKRIRMVDSLLLTLNPPVNPALKRSGWPSPNGVWTTCFPGASKAFPRRRFLKRRDGGWRNENRVYTILGKASLSDPDWLSTNQVPNARFFKVQVH